MLASLKEFGSFLSLSFLRKVQKNRDLFPCSAWAKCPGKSRGPGLCWMGDLGLQLSVLCWLWVCSGLIFLLFPLLGVCIFLGMLSLSSWLFSWGAYHCSTSSLWMGFLRVGGEVSSFIQEQIGWSPWSVLTESARSLPSVSFAQSSSSSFYGSVFIPLGLLFLP